MPGIETQDPNDHSADAVKGYLNGSSYRRGYVW